MLFCQEIFSRLTSLPVFTVANNKKRAPSSDAPLIPGLNRLFTLGTSPNTKVPGRRCFSPVMFLSTRCTKWPVTDETVGA